MKNLILSAAAALAVAASAAIVHNSNNSPANSLFTPSLSGASAPDAGTEIPPSIGDLAPSFRAFEICRQHIDGNFQRLVSVKQIALECHANVEVMRHSFQLYAHQDPYNYLMNLKRNQTAELSRQQNSSGAGGQYTLWGYASLAAR